MIFTLIRYLRHRTAFEKLPQIPTHLRSEYDPATVTDAERLVMAAGLARDKYEAQRRLERAESIEELLAQAQRRKRIDYSKRLGAWARRAEGSYKTPPRWPAPRQGLPWEDD